MKEKNKVVTIEKTSKKYKGGKVIGVCMIIAGIFAIGASPMIAGILIFAGLVVCVYSRIGAWWNNG